MEGLLRAAPLAIRTPHLGIFWLSSNVHSSMTPGCTAILFSACIGKSHALPLLLGMKGWVMLIGQFGVGTSEHQWSIPQPQSPQ